MRMKFSCTALEKQVLSRFCYFANIRISDSPGCFVFRGMTPQSCMLARWRTLASLIACFCFLSTGFAADANTKAFDVPAGAAEQALKTFSTQAGIEVVFATQIVRGVRTPAVKGEFVPMDALSRLLAGTSLVAKTDERTGAIVVSSGAFSDPNGQRVAPTATTSDHPAEARGAKEAPLVLESFVVTGSHIHGDFPPSSPVMKITQEDILNSGFTNVGDVIRSVPQNFSGGNNPQNFGSTPTLGNDNSDNGGTSPNLRGLGSGTTLTLLNGHRLAADNTNGGSDISFIPLDAIEQIDVVTDGASAVYGSDAMAGVVNFVLKKDYNGAQTGVMVGNSTDGGGYERQLSQLAGTTWKNGGAVFNYTHDDQTAVYSDERNFTALASRPTNLLPGSQLNSYFLSAHQDISPCASGFMDVLYGVRSTSSVHTLYGVTLRSADSVEQYDLNAGFTLKLPKTWQLTTLVSSAVNLATNDSFGRQPILNEDAKTKSIEENAEGPLLLLPAGEMRLALGAGYREEAFSYDETDFADDGRRKVKYAYGEFAVPVISPRQQLLVDRLDLNLSVRDDKYSDTGSKSAPKIGLVLAPVSGLSFRASWSKSFRAPPLFDKYAPVSVLEIAGFSDPGSPTGLSQVLVPSGGNLSLKPESSTSKTIGCDYTPKFLPNFKVAVTYYRVNYTNRIDTLPNFLGVLGDPTYSAFVIRNPSSALQQSLIASATGGLYNLTGGAFDFTKTAAVIKNIYTNIARQDIEGCDVLLDYRQDLGRQKLDFFANISYLDSRETITPISPEVALSGTAFHPSRTRVRGGATWSLGPVSTTGTVNFASGEVNMFAVSHPHVASWTTVDWQLAYAPDWKGLLAGWRAALSVRNVFDRDPPYVIFTASNFPSANYDANNASPIGRFWNVRLSKNW